MSCEDCDRAHDNESYAPFRIGNKEIGWGTILVKGCDRHIKLAFEQLRTFIPKG